MESESSCGYHSVINDFLLINPYFLDNTTPYSTFFDSISDANNEGGTVTATLEMDGEVVGRKVIKYQSEVVMQTGESPLPV